MDYTRFLWPSDIANPAGDLATYRFKVVPFGTMSLPFMLNAVINQHLGSSQVACDMKTNLCVGNLISGCNSEDEVIDYYQQSRCTMNTGRFNLRSWSSNSSHLCSVKWPQYNSYWFKVGHPEGHTPKYFTSTSLVTKREIICDLAQIDDPLGLVTPITVKAKILV